MNQDGEIDIDNETFLSKEFLQNFEIEENSNDRNNLIPIDYISKEPDVFQDSKDEVNAILNAFKEQSKKEHKQFVDNTDSEYWICIGFGNREQKEEFLRKSKLIELGDKYLDGEKVAEILKVNIKQVLKEQVFKIDKSWKEFI